MTTGTSAGETRSAAIGVEVGGKRATIALVNQEGVILHRREAKTLWGRPASATVEPYLRAIELVLAHASVEGYAVPGIGVSIPGTIDSISRRPLIVPTLPSLNGFPLGELLQTRFQLPIRLHVDVDAAAWAEYQLGAGRGTRRLLSLSINTVVGAAFMIDGKPERTDSPYLGHTCHIPVGSNGSRCGCGKRGCINTLLSIDAIQKMVQRALRRDEESRLLLRLSKHEPFSPQLLAEEAAHGDGVALRMYSEMTRWLVVALGRYISLFEPEMLLLGGSVLSASPFLFDAVCAALLAQTTPPLANSLVVAPTLLNEDAALIGAALPLLSQTFPQIVPPVQPHPVAQKKPRKRQERVALHLPDDLVGDDRGVGAALLADALHPPLRQGNA